MGRGHARRLLGASFEETEPAVNLTPLIDVVFVILFAFMVAAPLLEYERIELAVSEVEKQSLSPLNGQEAIQLVIRADEMVFVNKEPVALPDLRQRLLACRQKQPEANLQLFCDQKASFGTYQRVKGVAEQAGFAQLDLFLDRPPS